MPKQLNPFKILQSNKGTMMLLSLVLTAVLSTVIFIFASWQSNLQSIRLNQRIKFTAEALFQNVVVQVYNNEAWKMTAAGNSCMLTGEGCASGTGGSVILRLPDNSIYVDSTNPTDGFNLLGKRCASTSTGGYYPDGNDSCPFKYQLNWSAINCTSAKCEIRVTGTFFYSPASQNLKIPFSTEKYRIDLIRGKETDSLQAACTSLGGTFNQGSLSCSAPAEAPPCPPGHVLKVVVQGLPPVCESAIVSSETCATGKAAKGISATGVLICANQ